LHLGYTATHNLNGGINSFQYKNTPSNSITSGKNKPSDNVARKRDLLDSIDPDNLYIEEGNSSRKPTAEELLEHFGFLRCQSEDCLDEEKILGAPVELNLNYPKPTAAGSTTAAVAEATGGAQLAQAGAGSPVKISIATPAAAAGTEGRAGSFERGAAMD